MEERKKVKVLFASLISTKIAKIFFFVVRIEYFNGLCYGEVR